MYKNSIYVQKIHAYSEVVPFLRLHYRSPIVSRECEYAKKKELLGPKWIRVLNRRVNSPHVCSLRGAEMKHILIHEWVYFVVLDIDTIFMYVKIS